MKERQSTEDLNVRSDSEQEERTQFVAERIRDAMRRRGWVDDEGRPDITRLADATGVRWQTAQYWVEGRNKQPPRPKNLGKIARALDMSLEELIGAAMGREPEGKAWREFLDTELGRSMTPAERHALAVMLWPNRPPDVGRYAMALAMLRA